MLKIWMDVVLLVSNIEVSRQYVSAINRDLISFVVLF